MIDNNKLGQSTKEMPISLGLCRRPMQLEMAAKGSDSDLHRSSTCAGGAKRAYVAFTILANGTAFGSPIGQKDLGAFISGHGEHHHGAGFFSNEIQSVIMDADGADSRTNPNKVKK